MVTAAVPWLTTHPVTVYPPDDEPVTAYIPLKAPGYVFEVELSSRLFPKKSENV